MRVIEDEETVRAVAARMLRMMGFEPLLAVNGREGADLFASRAGEIAAVLLDLTMPKMSGPDVFRELRRIRGDVKVILTSGYGRQEATTGFEGKGLAGFVRKPFRADELLDLLFRTLDG